MHTFHFSEPKGIKLKNKDIGERLLKLGELIINAL